MHTIGKIIKKTMTIDVENFSFDELESEMSWDKWVPGEPSGGTPLEAFWRPLGTWRRVLRTIFLQVSMLNLGDEWCRTC